MGAVYPTWTIKAYLDAAWYNLTNYVTGRWNCDWGISGNGPIDFMADTGKLVFRLNNTSGLWSPNGANVVNSDWHKGALVKAEISFGGDTRIWFGQIDDFGFDPDELHNSKFVTVYVVDWMNKAARYPINYPDILLEQTADQAIDTIITSMPVAPLEQSFAVGETSFPVVFDTVTDFTYAMQEIDKILKSELCYFYVRHEGNVRNNGLGEKLVLENNSSRESVGLITIPTYDRLLMETGDFLLLETGDKILLNDFADFSSEETAMDYEVSYGDNVINDITFRYVPRLTESYGSSEDWCWFSKITVDGQSQEMIGAGETKIIKQNHGYQSAIVDFFANLGMNDKPVITKPFPISPDNFAKYMYSIDFDDMSADLSVLLTCYFDRFELTLANSGTQTGYLYSGFSIPIGSTRIIKSLDVPVYTQDAVSILANDYQPLSFDQVYQVTDAVGTVFANRVLAEDANPHTNLNRINYLANRGETEMGAFLSLDIGDMFPAVNASKGVDGNFFVQNMKFTVDPGNIIFYSLGMKEFRGVVFMGAAYSSSNGGSSLAWSDTIQNARNRLSIVTVALRGSEAVNSVTRGAQSYTLVGAYELGNTSGDPRVEIWKLVAPTVGTATVTVTLSAASQLEAGSMNFINVDQGTPLGTFVSAGATGGNAEVTTDGNANDLIVDIVRAYDELSLNINQTARWYTTCDNAWYGGSSTKPGGASVQMRWTPDSSVKWAIAAIAIKAKG